VFGTAQRNGLGDSPLTEGMYSSIETEEELEQLFNPLTLELDINSLAHHLCKM